jgi:hypothetical protein
MNKCCECKLNEERKILYTSLKGAKPIPTARDYYVSKTNSFFPEALEMVGNSSHQVWAIGKFLPFKATVAPSHLTYVDVFDAPLLMTGLKKSYDCLECKRKGHIILLNIRFLDFMNYMLYYTYKAIDKKLERTDLEKFKKLIDEFLSCKVNQYTYPSIELPPQGTWNTLTEMAFSWLMFHEIAHILQKAIINTNLIPDSFVNKSIAVEELSSDVSALNFLYYRMVASNPLDKERPVNLYLAAEFFIRTLSVIKSLYLSDLSPLKAKEPNSGLNHPSPYLRIGVINDVTDKKVSLGLIDESIINLRSNLNCYLEDMLNQLFKLNGINCIISRFEDSNY